MTIKGWEIWFRNPPKNKVLILNKTGSDTLKSAVLGGIDCTVYGLDQKRIFITPKIVVKFLMGLPQLKRKSKIISQLARLYFRSIVSCIQPRVVITFVDDDPLFHWLSRNYKGAEFFAIQNGTRTKKQLQMMRKYDLTNLFCFGSHEQERFCELGHQVDRFIPVGSVTGDYFFESPLRSSKSEAYDISIISQWRESFVVGDAQPEFKRAVRLLDRHLSRYVAENDLSLAYLRRGSGEDSEKKYLREVYGENVTLVDQDPSIMSTYVGMWNSDLVLTFYSTAAREALGWGKKVLFCDFSGKDHYNYFSPGVWLLTEASYDAFAERMDLLRNMTPEEYAKECGEFAKYMMVHTPGEPAHSKIRKHVLLHLQDDASSKSA